LRRGAVKIADFRKNASGIFLRKDLERHHVSEALCEKSISTHAMLHRKSLYTAWSVGSEMDPLRPTGKSSVVRTAQPGFEAQQRGKLMKAYLVLDLTVNDMSGLNRYIAEIPAYISKHSGQYIVRGVQPTVVEGDWKPERLVIIEFPERAKAEAFLGDREIQDLFKIRHAATRSRLLLVDGCTE
jgi:uncharacterized protein (DUF1330 family)